MPRGWPAPAPFAFETGYNDLMPRKQTRLGVRHAAIALATLIAVPADDAGAQTIITPQREKKQFTDAEIADGFFKVAFGAEFHLAGHVDRIRRYDKPVRVFIDNKARPNRRAKMREVIADIGRRIEHIDIAETTRREDANVTVTLVRDRDLNRTCLLYTSPSPRDGLLSRMPSSA